MEFYVAPGGLPNEHLVWQIKTPELFDFKHGFSSASVKKVVEMIEGCSGEAKM
jgi:hypothetical protein